jgi:hypothetical protein
MEPGLREAVIALSGVDLPPRSEAADLPASVGLDVDLPAAGAWPTSALELLDQAESRLRQGDYQGFGEALQELRRLLEELRSGGDGGRSGGE